MVSHLTPSSSFLAYGLPKQALAPSYDLHTLCEVALNFSDIISCYETLHLLPPAIL